MCMGVLFACMSVHHLHASEFRRECDALGLELLML